MKHSNHVKGVRSLGGHRLRVVFTDGYIGDADLWPLFANPRGPMAEPLKDADFFQRVTVDPELGVPTWPNGYDICADVLRYYCDLGHVASSEELETYFAIDPPPAGASASILNDKPNP